MKAVRSLLGTITLVCALLLTSATAWAAPTVSLTSKPAGTTNSTSARFSFVTTGAVAVVCSLDGSSYAKCGSPQSYSGLANGTHTFIVASFSNFTTFVTATYSWTVDTTAPTAPTVSAIPGSGTVTLNWTPSSDPDSSVVYVVYRNSVGVTFTTGTSFTDTGLTNAARYTYTIVAYDAAGNHSTPVNVTTYLLYPLGVNTANAGGSWSLAFDETFNGSSLDTSIWEPNFVTPHNPADPSPNPSYVTPGMDNPSCSDPARSLESGGYLDLQALQQTCTTSAGTGVTKTYPYASGLVNSGWPAPTFDSTTGTWKTAATHWFTGGYFEARIKLPVDSSGLPANHAAFWLTNTYNWPANGEIDIMEALQTSSTNYWNQLSCGSNPPAAAELGWHLITSSNTQGGCSTLSSLSGQGGWHTFGAYWQPGQSLTWYYDGREVGHVTSNVPASPMFILLDNSIDGPWDGNTADGLGSGGPIVAPSDMLVDYVRVWQ